MAVKHAEILNDGQYKAFLDFVTKGNHPVRDRAIVALSYKAGLRVQEIAMLRWENVLDVSGDFKPTIFVGSDAGKGHKEREVPMHPDVHAALAALRRMNPSKPRDSRVIYGIYKPDMSPNALCVWFHRTYQSAMLRGCSSHSGRRTFITKMARIAVLHDCSLKDVQNAVGHAKLETTEKYIAPSRTLHNLVAAI